MKRQVALCASLAAVFGVVLSQARALAEGKILVKDKYGNLACYAVGRPGR